MVNDFDAHGATHLSAYRFSACLRVYTRRLAQADASPYMRNDLPSSPLTRCRNKSPLSLTLEHLLLNLFWIAPNFQ